MTDAGARVRLDSAVRRQTLEGFGASIAWHAETLAQHPSKAEIYQRLFAELGLDILRFRNRHQRSREVVDLSAEQEILQEATRSLGRSPKLLLSSWSPPGSLKANADESCTGNADCTLLRRDGTFPYAEFAAHFADALASYSKLGLLPTWLSIQNEPAFIPNGHEGCRFEPRETADYPGYAEALRAVAERLESLEAKPMLLAAENLGVHYGTEADFQRALDPSLIQGVAHHLYERGNDAVWDWRDPGPDSFIAPMQSVRRAAGELPIFVTEFQTDEDNGTEGGFETAWLIHNALVEESASAFLYWALVWPNAGGVVILTPNGYALRDQYYSLRHYALYTDAGDQRIEVVSDDENIRASAFIAPDGARLTVVLLNVGERTVHVELDPGLFEVRQTEAFLTVYRPGRSERWIELGQLAELSLDLPERAVATVVFRE